jgi:hypothetical protein
MEVQPKGHEIPKHVGMTKYIYIVIIHVFILEKTPFNYYVNKGNTHSA